MGAPGCLQQQSLSYFSATGSLLAAGVLFFGDTAARGEKVSQYVQELTSRAELEAYLSSQGPDVLSVVDVSLNNADPCIHVFPAVLALAKNMEG